MIGQQTIGNYHIRSPLGQGGMGIVYLATHVTQGHTVALKVLAPHLSRDPAFVRRFQEEYRILRSFYHPHIVRVYEFGQDRGRYFVAVEYIAGTSLEHHLAGGRVLSLRETVVIVQQIASALDAVHPRGIVHRDLKPSNVLIERGGRVVLTDFGIASVLRERGDRDQSTGWWGTPEYMSPEQVRGDAYITYKADVYALGVMTYRMLSGRVPFQREMPLATLHAHIHDTPPPLHTMTGTSRILVNAERVVMQALAKDPARRQHKAGDFARQLGMTTDRRPSSAISLPLPLVVGGCFLLIIFILIALTGVLRQRSLSWPSHVSGTLAYVCQQGEETHICVRDGQGRWQSFSLGHRDWAPAWSPDGQQIALASDDQGETSILLLQPTSELSHSPSGAAQVLGSSPSWSPDGKRLAFDRYVGGNYDIYVLTLNSSTVLRLTTDSGRDSDPAWSPDGRYIAFVSDRDGGDLEIYRMESQGQDVTRLTNHTGWDFAPAWSPDDGMIAYECLDDTGDDVEICVMDGQGRNRRVLTDNGVNDRQPAWSLDGQYIAFCRERSKGSTWDIWVMESDGDNQQVLIRDNYSNTHPSWGP